MGASLLVLQGCGSSCSPPDGYTCPAGCPLKQGCNNDKYTIATDQGNDKCSGWQALTITCQEVTDEWCGDNKLTEAQEKCVQDAFCCLLSLAADGQSFLDTAACANVQKPECQQAPMHGKVVAALAGKTTLALPKATETVV